ncbi:KGK domain protein [Nostoc sp. PCC 7524]|uniref:KGK domain-containing protein n=1 Tax=Nostoc sp. (strain ATCC 29411 / PCC 7524) TaxID=28072 RepID=UPI00029ED6C9|nr:KGK domain-containing protein [Nostoc sp. PCC 7524]AFY50283.1 KGK domain protein [Nostoc sp. PCC 7524]
MNYKTTPLDMDDVVLCGEDTFKVSRLKQLIRFDIETKWNKGTYDQTKQKFDGYVNSLMRNVSIGNSSIYVQEVEYRLSMKCEILKIGGKNWQKGQMEIQVSVVPTGKKPEYTVSLEFYPDEIIDMESPLDDLRKKIKTNL